MADPLHLLTFGRPRDSADRLTLATVTGSPLAQVCQAPPLLARRLLRHLRDAPVPADRLATIARAGELFASADLDGETPPAYQRRFALATGIPAAVAGRAAQELRQLCAGLVQEVPAELAGVTRVVNGVRAELRRVPRGDTLAVIAPSNHPATHGAWLRALGYGLRVAVRPGGRDPFTPLRLARALRDAGDPAPLLVLAGPHETAESLVDGADLALVYGDERTVGRYAGRSGVAVRGPGRTKALLVGPPSDADLDFLAGAISADAGIRCTNVSAVFTDQPVDELAAGIGERLAALPVRPPTDPAAALPVRPLADARDLAGRLSALVAGGRPYPDKGFLADLGDGSAALRGIALAVDHAAHPAVGVELPLPFAVVAPWTPDDGVAPLRRSLAAVLLGADDRLRASAEREPSIHKVVSGPVPPWWTLPFLPHEGHLGDHLLHAKAVISGEG